MLNENLRKTLKSNHICLWQLADALEVSETTLCRWMRYQLPADREKEAFEAVKRILEERKDGGSVSISVF